MEYNIADNVGPVIEDLEIFLKDGLESGFTIHDIIIVLLLFADDMIIFENSLRDLQNNLNRLRPYCNDWSLVVNATKTRVMIFRT